MSENGSVINSPIGRVRRPTFNQPHQPRVLTVDDATTPEDLPQSVQRQPNLQQAKIVHGIAERPPAPDEQRMNPQRKRGLQAILGIGRIERTVPVDGVQFTLHTLNTRETKIITSIPRQYAKMENAGYDMVFEMRSYTLAFALESIDGVSFADVVGSDEFEDALATVYEFDEILAAVLYREYQDMVKEGRAQYKLDAQDTTDAAKEIVEDIKK